jgi:NitT/TauT family transport system substrate-binding protein
MRAIRMAIAAVISAVALTAVAQAAELKKITLVQSSLSFNFVPIYVAEKQGYFEQEGLKVEVILAGGGPKAMTALVGGGGQFSASVLLDGIMAHRRGLDDVRAIATLSYFTYPFAVRKEVAKERGITTDRPLKERIQALKGLRIAITTPGASSDMVARYIAMLNGLNPERDLQLVPLGGFATQLAGIQAGQVDGCSCLQGVEIIGKKQDLTVDVLKDNDVSELSGVTYGTLWGLASYMKANPDVANSMARAIARATLLIGSDPDKAKAASRSFFKQMDDDTYNLSWKTYLPYFPRDPDIKKDGYDKELKLEKAVLPPASSAPVPYDKVVDVSLVRKAMQDLKK